MSIQALWHDSRPVAPLFKENPPQGRLGGRTIQNFLQVDLAQLLLPHRSEQAAAQQYQRAGFGHRRDFEIGAEIRLRVASGVNRLREPSGYVLILNEHNVGPVEICKSLAG